MILRPLDLTKNKLESLLLQLKNKIADEQEIALILSEINRVFKSFYSNLGKLEFLQPKYLQTGDTSRSKDYNENLNKIYADIQAIYKSVDGLQKLILTAFNHAGTVNNDIIKRADSLGSIVLDLKVLSDFTRGDVIVAGDDFRSLDNVDEDAVSASPKAEKLTGSGGMSLHRSANRVVTDDNTDVELIALEPATKGGVNRKPTPGNVQRLYEGNYYNFIGQARPEGGRFNLKYMLVPKKESKISTGENKEGNPFIDDTEQFSDKNAGYYIEIGASEEELKAARLKMFDQDPETFWEVEYVYNVPQLITVDTGNQRQVKSTDSKTISVDFKEAERLAKKYDTQGRDLVIELVLTFPEQINTNYVILDPILFGANAFIRVEDISTASSDDDQFIVVDGWDSTKYAKTITPEANKFLTDSQLGETLAPTRYEYTGKGIFVYPTRLTKKLKIRLRMDNPVPSLYERYNILLKEEKNIELEVVTKTKKGLLRF